VYDVPFGPTEGTYLLVIEADDQGCARRIDIFGEDALRDAVVRLYERHAALLPEGAARTRAAATAKSMALLRSANADPERLAPVLAPDIEGIDHRHLSNWSLHGAPAYLDHLRALHQVADVVDFEWREVLALASSALLARTLHHGIERLGGGAYERWFLSLFVVGADGRFTRAEWFDEDREVEALARFEELVPGPVDGIGAGGEVSRLVRRRLRPNAASALVEGIEAGFGARDREALERLLSEPLQTIEHPTGVTYGREGQLESIDRMLDLPNLDFRLEALATLGDGLCLARRRVRASGKQGGRFDVADYEMDHLVLTDVVEDGVWRSEVFSVERFGAAVVRLYERHGERLGAGTEAVRSAGIARAVSAIDAPVDVGRLPGAYARDLTLADHRVLATWSCASRDELANHFGHQLELVGNFTGRIDDVLALGPTMLLAHVTYHGIGRDSGGPFENRICVLYRFGDDGRVAAIDCYEAEREADALARFDELTADSSERHATDRPSRRAVRANAATRISEGFARTIAARDVAALEGLLAEDLQFEHWPTGASYTGREFMATWRGAFKAKHLEFELEVIASLGDFMAVHRHHVTVEGVRDSAMADFGRAELDEIVVVEADAFGKCRRMDLYAPEKLGDGIVRLYEGYAAGLPQGAARTRSSGIAASMMTYNGAIDLDRVAAVTDPSSSNVDHRVFGTWTMAGADEVLRHYRQQLELAPDFSARSDDVLALAPDAVLLRMTFYGTARDSGGPFENPLLQLWTFGADGRVLHTESFEIGQESEALARFDALAGGPREGDARPSPTDRAFSNAASRLNERFARAWAERDWNTVSGAYVAGHHVDDRRRLMQMRLPDGDARAALRFLFDVPGSRWVVTPLATRGEHLVVSRYVFEGTAGADAGPIAIDYLALDQTDADGRFIETVLFDPDDLDAAYAELDRRYGAGDGRHDATWQQAHRLSVALPHGDIDACRAMLAPGFRVGDHRKLGWGDTLRDADTFLQAQLALTELSPDWRYRIDHRRARGLVWLGQQAQVGTREGGAFENRFLVVGVHDQQDLVLGFDIYDVDQLDQARARFEELTGTKGSSAALDPVASFFSNAAVAAVTRGAGALAARNWEEFRALFADDFRNFDRRALFRVESGRDEWLAAFRPIIEMTSGAPKLEVLATRGDRLALVRMLWRGAGGDVGPSEIDWLLLIELGIDGRHRAVVTFDAGDTDSAYAELDERFESGEGASIQPPASALLHAYGSRDWEAMAAFCAPGFAEHDRRRLSVLGTTSGPEAWVRSERSFVELAPDTKLRLDHVVGGARGSLSLLTFAGEHDRAEYEMLFLVVAEPDSSKRLAALHLYDPEQLPEARAKFEAIRDSNRPRLRVWNRADAFRDPIVDGWHARDWPAIEGMLHEDFRISDRRPLFLLDLDRDGWIEMSRRFGNMDSSRLSVETIATRGERLVLWRVRIEVAEGDVGPSLVEHLNLFETNEERDRLVWAARFETTDVAAAYAELDARYEAGEAARPSKNWRSIAGFVRAVERRDWDAVRALCREDFVEQDHRGLAVLGGTDGADAWVDNFRTLVELAPDTVYRAHHVLEAERGYFVHGSWYGTREGGPYELQVNAVLELDDAGRFRRADMYDDAVTDAAFARLAELTPSLAELRRTSAPQTSNAAMRAMSNWFDAYDRAFETGSWDELRRGCHPSFVFDDRRRMALLDGGLDLMVASARERAAMGARPEWHPVGFFGDRVFVQRVLWVGGPSDGPFEIEYLGVVECDENGLLTAFVLFDLDDARAAQREAWARWAAIEPDVAAVVTPVGDILDAFNEKSAVKWRAAFADELVVEDHRLAGMGRIEGADAYTESVVALWKIAPVTHADIGWRWLALDRHGAITVVRRSGVVPDGSGDFENEYLYLYLVAQGRITRIELFEMNALDKALACFDEQRSRR
jgi:ketosteroid isomerase-like protein